jgi:hypothetical protein
MEAFSLIGSGRALKETIEKGGFERARLPAVPFRAANDEGFSP